MVQTYVILQEASGAPKVIWRRVDKTTPNRWIAFNRPFVGRKEHWSRKKRKFLSMLKSPRTDEPGNPQKLPNPISMLTSVGRAYLPARYQVSSLVYTPVRNKIQSWWSGCQGVFWNRLQIKGSSGGWASLNTGTIHGKNRKNNTLKSLSFLHSVDLEVWNVPFHETASFIANVWESKHVFFHRHRFRL